ncbi:MAG: hypothetical protein V1922_03195 [bacterium]
MFITPDLKQNILMTIYLTISDNFFAIVYAVGIIISAFLAIRKPSRYAVFMLLGFILLLFGFEYNKHILEGLKEQTINALITVQEHNKVRRIINIVLVKALPLLLPLFGWGFVISGIYLLRQERKITKVK